MQGRLFGAAVMALLSAIALSGAASETPSWLLGGWTREWVRRDGKESNPREVHYVQVPKFFADVRIPVDRAAPPDARSFDDLTDRQLRDLARAQAFTGWTGVDGLTSTWHHEIDFEPPDASPDIGRVERLGDGHVLEHAMDGSYTESWRRTGAADGPFLAVRVQQEIRVDRVLLVAGDQFLYRAESHGSAACQSIARTVDRRDARSRDESAVTFDCEFSFGRSAAVRCPGRFSARRSRGAKGNISNSWTASDCHKAA